MWTSFGTMLLFALGMKCLVAEQTGQNYEQSLCEDANENSYLRPDPQNCSQFYSCGPQTFGRNDLDYLAELMVCPYGLLFNPDILVCDYSYNVTCYNSGSTYPYNSNNNNVANNNNNNINSGGNNANTINQNSNSGDNVAVINNNTSIIDGHTNIEDNSSNDQITNTELNSNNYQGGIPYSVRGNGQQVASTLDGSV